MVPRDKAKMTVAGGFSEATETVPSLPCCWYADYLCSVCSSRHLNKFPYFLSPILATHYSFVLCVLYGGLGGKDIVVKTYDSGKHWQYQWLKNFKHHCYFCFKLALPGTITTSKEQTKI